VVITAGATTHRESHHTQEREREGATTEREREAHTHTRTHTLQACRMPYALIVDGELREMGDVQYLLSPQVWG
jgi:hypothetical protein